MLLSHHSEKTKLPLFRVNVPIWGRQSIITHYRNAIIYRDRHRTNIRPSTWLSDFLCVYEQANSLCHQILIYAKNAKGRSKPLVMETETLRDAAERRTEKVIDGSLKGMSNSALQRNTCYVWECMLVLGIGDTK